MTSDAYAAHEAATRQLAATAQLAEGNWSSEWDASQDAGQSTFAADGRSVTMETDFTGQNLYYTRDDPNRFGKTHLDSASATAYLRGSATPF